MSQVCRASPSLRDLAKRLGVSLATVSRALGHDGGVSEKRADEIRSMAEALGYQPQPFRRKYTGAIALVFGTDTPDAPSEYFVSRIIAIAQRIAAQHQLHIHTEFVERKEGCVQYPNSIAANRVDGVLLAGHPPAGLCHALADAAIPAIAILDSPDRTRLPCVSADFREASRELIDRLVAHKSIDIAIAYSNHCYPTVAGRFAAIRDCMRKRDLPMRCDWQVGGLIPSPRGGRTAIQRLMSIGSLPQVLICENDLMALGAMHELLCCGKRVPHDMNLVGYDNSPLCQEFAPPLTTIDLHEDEIISLAWNQLLALIKDRQETASHSSLSSRLIWRGSCGIVSNHQRKEVTVQA